MAMDTANFAGLSQTGAPVTVRGSTASPTIAAASTAIISRPDAVRGALPCQSFFNMLCSVDNVITVNMTIARRVDIVNIKAVAFPEMARTPAKRPHRKRPGQYHHGDLQRAMLEQALRTIQTDGVETLTLRAVGEQLGVSRTALYRHFSDKQALLA